MVIWELGPKYWIIQWIGLRENLNRKP
jgi:hypothetical protein